MRYISNTPSEQEEMLAAIGVEEISELFSAIPNNIKLDRPLEVPGPLSELEIMDLVNKKAAMNTDLTHADSYLGAGAYDHYLPSIIDHMALRSEFYTAYTPYQAELSQGTLQAIYEYQSMISELTGMGISNASLLDGGSAMGEAALMALRITRLKKLIMPKTIHPSYREIAKTYGHPHGAKFAEIDLVGSLTDLDKLEEELDDETAAVIIQYPNFYGSVEDMQRIADLVGQYKKALLIVVANPIALGMLTPPGEFGADIVVGEGQPLGNVINYGGPYLGYMAIKDDRKILRQMPGRLVGKTEDVDGNEGFVMTMQTREQHIRREKATSNICTNESLNALMATIYMAAMGKKGLQEVASQCFNKTRYLKDQLEDISGIEVVNGDNHFHEIWVKTEKPAAEIFAELYDKQILAGVDLSQFDEEEGLLICVTEKKSREKLDELISAMEVAVNA
ncbi:MAG: aminomethyl-transferring glycine dehydrogenase subunit GcvPA [Bacillota bacterium]